MWALSADDSEEARAMVEDHGVEFPVLYGFDASEAAERIGAYHGSELDVIQPAGFILQGGEVVIATYSNGPVGRLGAAETIEEIDYLRDQEEEEG